MNEFRRCLGAMAILLFQLGSVEGLAKNNSGHQLQISVTLSGHLLLGAGYCYFWDAHHAGQVMFYLVPEKGWPYGIAGGYRFNWAGKRWQPTLGAEAMMLASPADPDRRKFLPMLKLEPGLSYQLNSDQQVQSRLWIAYFLKRTRTRIAPIGLEFIFGRRY